MSDVSPSRSSLLSLLNHEDRHAVIIVIGRANDEGHTSTVYCLNVGSDLKNENYHVLGKPFRLHDQHGRYIWYNYYLRQEGLNEGSIISYKFYKPADIRYYGNAEQRMEISKVLSQLRFDKDANSAVAFRGIAQAFPDAVIAPSGDNQRGINRDRRPVHPYALISVKWCVTVDDRLIAVTRLDEEINLNNRSRGEYKKSNIEPALLPVREPSSKDDVGDVILCAFSNKATFQFKYEAICEGILLSSHQTQDIDEYMSPDETLELSAYPISSSPRGICLIINNLCFDEESKNRFGGEKDEEALGELFGGELNFDIHVEHDLENLEMQRVAEEFAAKDYSGYDAFVCIIMSHGKEHDLIEGIKGRTISTKKLMSKFKPKKCPTLAEKPKVLIFQACRGLKEDESMQSTSECTDSSRAGFLTDSTVSRSVTPQESDFLLAFSTVPGHVSYRTPESGSLFIQTLVEVIRKYHKKEHLADMLTIVTRHVAEKGSQVPAPVSTLRYKLYL